MRIVTGEYFEDYKSGLTIDISKALTSLDEIEVTPHSFTFYTSVAVISSSRIEGERLEIDSYVKHKMQNVEYLAENTEKPNDLYRAYLFAKDSELTKNNFFKSHLILSEHLLPVNKRGVMRSSEMVILEHNTGRIQFEAASTIILENEMSKLWEDISELLMRKLNDEEVFYYASFIHAAFVAIHPFEDGNGRLARLLEKWFLAHHLGEIAWYIKSEKYYYHNVNEYYLNLNRMGIFYEEIDYSKADRFFRMLPQSIAYSR
jgi:Fic family protein